MDWEDQVRFLRDCDTWEKRVLSMCINKEGHPVKWKGAVVRDCFTRMRDQLRVYRDLEEIVKNEHLPNTE